MNKERNVADCFTAEGDSVPERRDNGPYVIFWVEKKERRGGGLLKQMNAMRVTDKVRGK